MSKIARKRERTWSSKRDGLGATTTDAATANLVAAAARLQQIHATIKPNEIEHITATVGGARLILALTNLTGTLARREQLFSGKAIGNE